MSDLLCVRNGALEHAIACHGMPCIAIKGTERHFFLFFYRSKVWLQLNWFDFSLTFSALGGMMLSKLIGCSVKVFFLLYLFIFFINKPILGFLATHIICFVPIEKVSHIALLSCSHDSHKKNPHMVGVWCCFLWEDQVFLKWVPITL